MSKVLLIHGYSCGIKYSFFREKRLDGSYKLIKEKFQTNCENRLFWWTNLDLNLNFWQCLNPKNVIGLYFREKAETEKQENQAKLYQELLDYKPDFVVAHSMGCHFLAKTLENYGHNTELKKIVFLASDDDFDSNNTFFKNSKLEILSYSCFWDYTLWLSCVLNFKIRAGLFGYQDVKIKNIFAAEMSFVPHNYYIASDFLETKIYPKL
jgi:hypothetical protein